MDPSDATTGTETVYVITHLKRGVIQTMAVFATVDMAEKKYKELLATTGVGCGDPLETMFANIRGLKPGFTCTVAAGDNWVAARLLAVEDRPITPTRSEQRIQSAFCGMCMRDPEDCQCTVAPAKKYPGSTQCPDCSQCVECGHWIHDRSQQPWKYDDTKQQHKKGCSKADHEVREDKVR